MSQSKEDGNCKIIEFTFTSHPFSFLPHGMSEERLSSITTTIVAPIKSESLICARYIKEFIVAYSLPKCEAVAYGRFNVNYMCKKACEEVTKDSCFDYVNKSPESTRLLYRQTFDCFKLPETDCNIEIPKKGRGHICLQFNKKDGQK